MDKALLKETVSKTAYVRLMARCILEATEGEWSDDPDWDYVQTIGERIAKLAYKRGLMQQYRREAIPATQKRAA